MNKYKKMFIEDLSNCYRGKIKLNYTKDDIRRYRKYQETLKENKLVNPKTPSFASSKPKPGIFIIDLVCAILVSFFVSRLTTNIFPIITSIFVSQYIAYAIMCGIEYYLWLLLPLRKYTEKTKSFEKYQRQIAARKKIDEDKANLEKSSRTKFDLEFFKTLDSHDSFVNDFLRQSVQSSYVSHVRMKVLDEYNKTSGMLRSGYKLTHSNKYHRFLNIYLKEILHIICENEKNRENNEVYREIANEIVKSFYKLQRLIEKENSHANSIQNMDIKSSFVALDNLFKQDYGEDF